MNRRTLLKLGSLATLSVFGVSPARTETSRYPGPYLISLHADGGWDPTLLCDAKPASAQIQQNLYRMPKRLSSGVSIAPISLSDQGVVLDTVESFFAELGSRLLVVNGIDTQTNNHDTGIKHVWSGKSSDSLPSVAAILAARVAEQQSLPVAYLSTGGYDATDGLLPLTRITGGGELVRAAHPRIQNPEDPPERWQRFVSSATAQRLETARMARLSRLSAQAQPARYAQALQSFADAKKGTAGFAALAALLPAKGVEIADAFPALPAGYSDPDLRSALQAVQLALLAFKSGQGVSASLAVFGFDTHANHDVDQTRALGRFLLTIRYLFSYANKLGLSDQLYVLIGSDFGRTPSYNFGAGKDHWNVTSMMFAGPGIVGGRVLGGTDDQLRPLSVRRDDPKVLLGYDDPNGTRILPAHVQRAVRKRLGLLGQPLEVKYSLPIANPLDDLLT